MNQTYKIKENGFSEVRKRLLLIILPVFLIAICFAFGITVFAGNVFSGNINTDLIPFALVIGISVFIIVRQINKQKKIFESITLTITKSNIILEKLNARPISIQMNEVIGLNHTKKGGLTIIGKLSTIDVPAQIENKEKLVEFILKLKEENTTVEV